ncbi:MAG TPA: ABC transporter permease [Vicinamibacterales bacterium]
MFSIFAIVSLALGVGVTTAMFSIVRATLWKPPSLQNPQRVVFVGEGASGRVRRTALSPDDYQDVTRSQRSFSALAASRSASLGLGDDAFARMSLIEGVTGSYFEVFGIRPLAGRLLDAADDTAEAQVAVVSQGFWRTRMSSAPDAVGRPIRIAGRAFTVVGIAGQSFDGTWMHPARQTSAWIPIRSLALVDTRSPQPLTAIGRLKPDAGAPQASAELASMGRELDRARPLQLRNERGETVPRPRNWLGLTAAEEHAFESMNSRSFGMIITILISMVLVVACTNLANLMMARGAGRATDRAVRQALGASRWRLVREHGIEASILAAFGAVGAYGILRALIVWSTVEFPLAAGQSMRIVPELSIDALMVAAGAVTLSLLVFGVGPALQLTRSNPRGVLAGSAGSVGRLNQRSQRRLIRWQVAIASGFFIIATLFMKSVVAEARHDSGIDLERLAVAVIDFGGQRRDETTARREVARILEQAAAHPAVEAVAVSSGLHYGIRETPWGSIARGDDAFVRGRDYPGVRVLMSTPEIFRTAGVRILHGRGFDRRDTAGTRPTAVLSAKTARELFGTTDAVGRDVLLRLSARSLHGTPQETHAATVIGIASDTDVSNLKSSRDGVIYMPLTQHYAASLTLVARARTSPEAAVGALTTSVAKAVPGLAVSQSGTGRAVLAGFYFFARAVAAGVTALGFLTLALSMTGLYGVLAQGVTLRTREVGLRIALGAERRRIARMILADGFVPIAQGLFLGLLLGYIGRALIRYTLDADIPMLDPIVLVIVPIPVVVAGFLACFIPARRAAQVDPNVALRAL